MTDSLLPYWAQFGASLAMAPLLPGIISRIKAIMAGRQGKPLLQTYYDIGRLLRKNEVSGICATWPFYVGPAVILASAIAALLLMPIGGLPSPLAFYGDFLLAAYCLAMGRFSLMLAALATGSSFEGMGASREAAFGAIAEPALFLGFLILSSVCLDLASSSDLIDSFSLSTMFHGQSASAWQLQRPELFLAPVIFFILLLAENCRIPVDDPATHLELTMIHEVMILDHSGPNLAILTYASCLKLWFFTALIAGLITPPLPGWQSCLTWFCATFVIAILVGIVESVMARLRLLRVPQLIGMASVLAALGLVLAQAN